MSVDDDRLARDLATEAGRRLLELRGREGFCNPAALRDAGDRLSHEYLTAALAACRPADAVLSEEGADDRARLAAQRVWILDPLDGTREFGEAGRTDWAVHVALWESAEAAAGRRPTTTQPNTPPGRLAAGAVALPAQGRTFSTMPGGTAGGGTGGGGTGGGAQGTARGWAGGAADGEGTPRLRLVVSRTRPPAIAAAVAARLGADLIELGSAGAKIIAVLTGTADAYVHAGGQHEWDSAAGVAVVQAAGLHASRIDGRPLSYNKPDTSQPDILVCRSAVAQALLAAIRSAYPPDGPDATR